MDIRSILVNVDLDVAASTSLKYAIDLARTFDAELIGIAADSPNMTFIGADVGGAAADFYVMEQAEIEKRLRTAEEQFHALMPAGLKSEWRSYLTNPTRAVVDTARRADLIVTGPTFSPTGEAPRRVDLGELVISSGRPVVDVAKDAIKVAADKIVIGWKDTREARRAVADAMPFLQRAKDVAAVTVSEGDAAYEKSSLEDLLAWLARHGVSATSELVENKEGYEDVLETNASFRRADMLIAGGYGHSRTREWLFGGVTRNLLKVDSLTRFFSN